ncbi:MAG: hypothetical protein ACREJ2_17040, partial [Planctomycetota bacterium]
PPAEPHTSIADPDAGGAKSAQPATPATPAADDDDDPLPGTPNTPNTPKTLPPGQAQQSQAPAASIPPFKPKNPLRSKSTNPIDALTKTTEPTSHIIYGPRVGDDMQNKVQGLFLTLVQQTQLQLKVDHSDHITLIASPEDVAIYLPEIKALERKLEFHFAGSIKKGIDKRSAVIVLLESKADYQTWITAEFKALGIDKPPANAAANGQGAGALSPLDMALKGTGEYLPISAVIDLSSDPQQDKRKKTVVYSVGYLYMYQLGEGHAPDCFVTGFGNYCESLMYNEPMTRVYSYEQRTIGNGPAMTWATQVRTAIQQRSAATAPDVLGFSTVTMKQLEYAEAWSFVNFLTQRPREFEGVVDAVRDENSAMTAIDAYYHMKDAQLTYQWQVWAAQQN